MNSISVDELITEINCGKYLNIIDIRDNYLYLKSHIEGSINIEEVLLRKNISYFLNKNTLYYIYCRFGGKSFFLCEELNSLGYNTVNIEGGYKEYLLKNHY